MKNPMKKIMAPTKYLAAIIALLGLLLFCTNTSWGQTSITVPNGDFSANSGTESLSGLNPYTVTGWTITQNGSVVQTTTGVTSTVATGGNAAITVGSSGVVSGALKFTGTISTAAANANLNQAALNVESSKIDISSYAGTTTSFTYSFQIKVGTITGSAAPWNVNIRVYDLSFNDITATALGTQAKTQGNLKTTTAGTYLTASDVASLTGTGTTPAYISIQVHLGQILDKTPTIDNFTLTAAGAAASTTLAQPGSTALSYTLGAGPSASQSFTVAGANLGTNNITVAPGANIELSSDNSTFASSTITLTPTSGTVATTTLYARLIAGLVLGTGGSGAARQVNVNSIGTTTKTIQFTGSINGFTTTNPASTALSYSYGSGPSAEQSYSVQGNGLTNNLVITAGSNMEVSTTSGSGFSSSVTLTPTSLVVAATTVYVRLKAGLAAATYSDATTQVVVSSTGFNDVTKQFDGNVFQTVTSYYYNGTGLLSSNTSWGVNTDGTGANPTAVTDANANFVITNGPATTAAAWTLGTGSKVIVGNGSAVSLTVADNFPITGTIDAAASGVVVWKHLLSSPTFGILDNASEVHLTPAANASYGLGNGTAYGKLFIDGAGKVSVLAGITSSTATVKNAFTVASGSTLDFPVTNTHSITINAGASATINGTVKAGKEEGFAGTVAGGATTTKVSVVFADAIPNLTLGTSSTIDYYRPNAAQTVSALPSGVNYANLTLSETGCTAATSKVIPTTGVTVNGTLTVSLAGVAFASTTVNADKITLANGATIVRTLGALDAAPLYSGTYNVTYNGTTAQTIGVELPTAVSNALNNLTVNNVAGVTLGSNTTINGMLTLTSGKLILPANGILRIASGNAIVGGSLNNYIVADPSAVVRMDAIASERVMPIGNTTKYLPITITPASAESLNIKVFEGITANAVAGVATLTAAQKTSLVDAVWNISLAAGSAASNRIIKVEWPASLEGAGLAAAAAADLGLISNSGTGGWNSPTGSVDKTNHSATATVTSFGSFSAGRVAMLFAQPAAKTYGDADFPAVVNSLNTSAITYVSDNLSVATIAPNKDIHIVGAGTATITASQVVSSDGVYAAVSISRILTVNKKSLTITAANKSKYVGQTNPALTVTYSNDFIAGESEANLTVAPTLSTTALTNSVVGTYSITASGAVSDNYSFIYIDGTLTVNPKLTQTISFSVPATKVYGDADVSVPASSDNNTIAITYSSSNISVATIAADGTLHIVGAGSTTITASQAGDATYDAASNAKSLTVNKATLTITAENKTRFISQPNPALTVTYAGFVLGDSETNLLTPVVVSTTALTNSDPGNYPVTASGATAANYDIIFVNGTLTIMTAPFEFNAMSAKTYGDADFDGGATSINTTQPIVYVSSNLSVATIVNGKIHIVGAGTTDITASQLTDGYFPAGNITWQLLVNKAASGIVYGSLATKTYGNADYTAAATSANGEQAVTYASSNPAVATISSSGNIHIVGAGVADITVSQSGNSNYLAESVIRQLTISKAALTITADDKVKYEGQANPALTATYTGFVLAETASVLLTPAVITTTAVTGSVPATYPITVGGATASNYVITFVSGNLQVNAKLTQTITFVAPTAKVYGNADFAAGGSSTNASIPVLYTSSNTAVATIVGTNVHIVGAGTADITASQAGSDVYVAATSVVKTLTVSKAALKITADNKSKISEQVNPLLTVTYTGFVLSETSAVLQTPVVISTTAVTASLPGTYPITASAAVAANYTISFVAGTLTVNPKTVQTISFAAPAAKMYGNADFAAGGTSTNATLPVLYSSSNQGVATIIGNMIHIVGAGTTVITASQNGDALYYPALNVSRTLTVSKAPLTIKAIDTTKIQGEDNPVFVFTYTGLVLGETGANLFTKGSTIALKGSAAGHYSIAPTGADTSNYSITYVSGRFTIYPPAGKNQINLNAYRSSSSQLTLQIYSTQFIVADAILYNLNGTPIKSVGCNVPKGFSTTKMDLPFLLPGLYIIKVKGWSIDCKKIISIL